MSRVMVPELVGFIWSCDTCGLLHTPPIGPDGRPRLPQPSEMRGQGWEIGDTVVLDLCPICVTLPNKSNRKATS